MPGTPEIPRRDRFGARVASSQTSIEEALRNANTSLADLASAFEKGVKLKDRTYQMKTYKDTFTGSSAVSFFVKKGICKTRQDALLIGRLLNEEFKLFDHVGFIQKDLWDCSWTVYQFLPSEQRKARQSLKLLREESLKDLGQRGSHEVDDLRKEKGDIDPELQEFAQIFRKGIKIKHHRYRGKLYRNTFIGSQAIDFLVNSSLANNRREALQLGRRLMDELKLFDHVTRSHPFSDDYLFYRLEEHRSNEKASVMDAVGQVLQDSLSSLPIIGEGKHAFQHPSNIISIQSDEIATPHGFLPLEEIARELRKHVEIKDRRYLFSTYKDTFIGSEAVDYLVGKTTWVSSRQEAVQLGNTLMRELELFRHVAEGHAFEDEYYFYKFTDDDEETMLERLQLAQSEVDTSVPFADHIGSTDPGRLAELARSMEEGLEPKAQTYRFRVYKNVCVGSEIVSFLVDNGLAPSRREAVQLGRAVSKHFYLFEHVTVGHLLKDSTLFYRFVPRENRWKGKWFENTYGRALRDKMTKATRQRTDLTKKEYWEMVLEAVEHDIWDIRASVRDQKVKNFKIDSPDTEWNNRVRSFEIEVSARASALRDSGTQFATVSSNNVRGRAKCWAKTFLRLDPRQQIHRFYNEVAQTGLTLVEESEGDSSQGVRAVTLEDLRPLFRFLPINLASVFSVWRPTSYDAIRKMMTGEAVGKGLDIKGKSAKRGKLSGYVPFLQISNNNHKKKVRRLSPHHTVRVFYKSDCRRARDIAIVDLENILVNMLAMVADAKKILSAERADKEMHDSALEVMLLDMSNPSILSIDDYAPDCYGIEMPERLFWEAYFVNQDCTRQEGSIYDSGRPSQPAYQDMNFAALRGKPHEGAPRPVVFQNADRDDPMNPFEMLMAYEEHGRVRPVVSDFDCFLVGTRRVDYNMPLAEDQVEVLKWCVRQIETIVETQRKENLKQKNTASKPFSMSWLEVLKNSGFHPEIPRFGFGDPVSYSIVQNAVERLQLSGAVRHGAECFNYYFPQDLDDQFLLVCQDIGTGNVPWKYVNADELLDFLVDKIDEGFCFPLNPKWILMDFGWMNLYRKMLNSSHEHVRNAMNVWFPPETGIREDLERIYALQKENYKIRHPTQCSYRDLPDTVKEEMMYFT